MSKTVLEAIAAAKFIATDAQVEALASVVVNGNEAKGTYLQVLTAHVLHDIEKRKKRRLTNKAARAAVSAAHDRLYAFVLKGVGPEDIDQPERNRRSTFARTAASALRKYVARGGDLRELNPGEISKAKLRGEVEAVPTGTRTERSVARSGDSFVRSIERLAKTNRAKARTRLEAMRERLDALLATLATNGKASHKGQRRAPASRVTRSTGSKRQPSAGVALN